MSKKAKLLITGGAGYVGSHFVHFLVQNGSVKGKNILVLDNLSAGHRQSLPKEVEFKKQDLRDKEKLAETVKDFSPDVAFHFAANTLVGESMEKPDKYLGDNVVNAVNLMRALDLAGCRHIIFSSSCAVYGTPKKTPISESNPILPINPYGQSKAMIEQVLEWYDKVRGIKYMSLRYFNAAGADFGIGESHSPETHLIPIIMETILGKRDKLKIYGTDYPTPDGTCIRDYIHITDLASAHLKAWEKLSSGVISHCINLGTGEGVSVKEVIDKAVKIAGKDFPREEIARREGDPASLIADPSLADKVLNWKAKLDIDDVISSAWRWHKGKKF